MSIFVTSSTTCVAFLSNAVSELVPIRAFGVFAAIIVPVNYVLMCLMIPPAMIIYETKYKHRCLWLKFCKKKTDEMSNKQLPVTVTPEK
jgi:predicted RND superfamily exporter protein